MEIKYPIINIEKSYFYITDYEECSKRCDYLWFKKTRLKGKKMVDSEQRLFVVKQAVFNHFYGPLWGYNPTFRRLAVVDFEFLPDPQFFPLDELKMIITKTLKLERKSILNPRLVDERIEALRKMEKVSEIIDYLRPNYHDHSATHAPWKFLLKSERETRSRFKKLLGNAKKVRL